MKTHFLLILLFAFGSSISSCNKSYTEPGHYLKAKINGTWVTFDNAVSDISPDFVDQNKIDLSVTAHNVPGTEILDFTIQSDTEIKPGTYSSDDPNFYIDMGYMKNVSVDPVDYGMNSIDGMPIPKFVITITSITDKEIRGTFTGNYLSEFSTGEVQDVTQGEFVAPRAH